MTFISATPHKKALSVDLLAGLGILREAEREETVLVAESVCVEGLYHGKGASRGKAQGLQELKSMQSDHTELKLFKSSDYQKHSCRLL